MKIASKLVMLSCSLIGVIIISIIGYNIFTNTNQTLTDRHIRELKYEAAQKHEEQNSFINKKLEEDYGQEDKGSEIFDRQEDEQAA